jgi:hypothetical protein
MVRMPSTITVEGWPSGARSGDRVVRFRVLAGDRRAVVKDGAVVLGE